MPICAVRVLEHWHDSHCHLNSTYYIPGTMPSALCEVINPPAAAGARVLPSSEFYRWGGRVQGRRDSSTVRSGQTPSGTQALPTAGRCAGLSDARG